MSSLRTIHRWDLHKFILEIKIRGALWDPKHTNYMNKSFTKHLWEQVAEQFGVKAILARQKWKNLRDTFRAEAKKIDAGKTTSTWTYYNDMLFLKPLMKTRKSENYENNDEDSLDNKINDDNITDSRINNLKEEDVIKFASVNLDYPIDDDDDDDDNDYLKDVHDEIDIMDNKNMEKLTEKSVDEDKPLNDEEDDETLLFFRSLLPFVKKLPENKVLLFRMDVQQALYKQLYETTD